MLKLCPKEIQDMVELRWDEVGEKYEVCKDMGDRLGNDESREDADERRSGTDGRGRRGGRRRRRL